jgi:hypothetical protein
MPIDPAIPPTGNPGVRQAERFAAIERRLRSLETGAAFELGNVPVVAALPAPGQGPQIAPGRQGRIVMLALDSSLWKDTGTAWVLV